MDRDDIKFLGDGTKVKVIEKVRDDLFLVQKFLKIVFDYGEGDVEENEDLCDEIIAVEKVFNGVNDRLVESKYKAIGLLETKIKSLEDDISTKRSELREIQMKIHRSNSEADQAARENEERIKSLSHVEGLKNIKDFIDGKITHFVMGGWDRGILSCIHWEIKTLDEVLEYRDDREKTWRLLGLYGYKDRSGQRVVGWKVANYSDGSGYKTDCIPATSKEEAKEIIVERLKTHWEEFKKNIPIRPDSMNNIRLDHIEFSKSFGVDPMLPDEYINYLL